MIEWLRTKTNPVPNQYDCLLLLGNGDVLLGRPAPGMVIVGWSVVNRPDWVTIASSRSAGESHHQARLSDEDCELVRQLYGEGVGGGGLSYMQIHSPRHCQVPHEKTLKISCTYFNNPANTRPLPCG
jgi:hypothetical protein